MSNHTRIELYVDDAGEHRWRFIGANSEPVNSADEGFVHRNGALDNLQLSMGGVYHADRERALATEAHATQEQPPRDAHRVGVLNRVVDGVSEDIVVVDLGCGCSA